MPRGFSESQKRIFKEKLLASAREALKRTGVRKTTVEELAKASNLSTGAFYKFYPSKEALFFEVYENAEEDLKQAFIDSMNTSSPLTGLSLRSSIKGLLRSDAMQTLIQILQRDDLPYLLNAIDPEIVQQHLQKDREYLQNIILLLKGKGLTVDMDIDLLLAYLQALFVLSYQKDQYPQHAGQIIDSFIDTIVSQAIA